MNQEMLKQQIVSNHALVITNDVEITVTFDHSPKEIMYCAIRVFQVKSGKLKYYYGGAVWNFKDHYNPVTAAMQAFKSALRSRFVLTDGHKTSYRDVPLENNILFNSAFERYYKFWAHVLMANVETSIERQLKDDYFG